MKARGLCENGNAPRCQVLYKQSRLLINTAVIGGGDVCGVDMGVMLDS